MPTTVNFPFNAPIHTKEEYGVNYMFYFAFQTRSGVWYYAEIPMDITERDASAWTSNTSPQIAVNTDGKLLFVFNNVPSDGFTQRRLSTGKIYDVNGNELQYTAVFNINYPYSTTQITRLYYGSLISDAAPITGDYYSVKEVNSKYQIKTLFGTSLGTNTSAEYHAETSMIIYTLVDNIDTDITITFNGVDPETYNYGDTSTADGGQGGSFDKSSTAVDFATLPTGGAASVGLISMFTPTTSELASFGSFLWSSLFDATYDSLLTSLKKWFNDPLESVIQLSAFPVSPPAGTPVTIKFCGIASDLVGSGVSMTPCLNQFMDFDFGSISAPAFWKQALDYTPYSKVSIYLPYIGICPLNIDDIIDATLHLKYHIDLLTGGFSAELKVTKTVDGTALASVLYNWSGNMATQIPITSNNFSQVFGSMMTAIAAIGVGAVSGGLGAAAAGEAASASAVATGALTGAGQGLAANIGNVINSKPHVTKSGRLDGTIGALSQPTPYLIFERPVQSLSSKFQTEQGYPSNIVQTLSNLSGLTVCEAPILDGIACTEAERDMIRAYLTSGVIL